MHIHITILGLILFIAFFCIWKNELLKSIFFTVFFIIILWINIPCFVSLSDLENSNNLITLPFKYNEQLGILYTIGANSLLGIILFFQSKFTNKTEYTYYEIKKMYDNFGYDAIELYVIGKDLDFLYEKKFKKQTNRILHLKSNCKLLCELTTDKRLLDLYKKISAEGVDVKFYTKCDNITNLKGQIKIDQNGYKKALFTSRLNKKYLVINIENQFLVSTILERCIKVYSELDD